MSKLIKKLFIIILVIVIAIGIIHKLNIKNYIMKKLLIPIFILIVVLLGYYVYQDAERKKRMKLIS